MGIVTQVPSAVWAEVERGVRTDGGRTSAAAAAGPLVEQPARPDAARVRAAAVMATDTRRLGPEKRPGYMAFVLIAV
jgi:hypothetical protein